MNHYIQIIAYHHKKEKEEEFVYLNLGSWRITAKNMRGWLPSFRLALGFHTTVQNSLTVWWDDV